MIKDENYINIQGFMVTKLGLSGNDLLVYAIIYGFSQDGESVFRGTRKYLAEWCNATERGIQKNLNNLMERNLIEQVFHSTDNHLVCYKVTDWATSEQSSPVVVNKVHDSQEQSSLAYNNLENKLKDKQENVSTNVDTGTSDEVPTKDGVHVSGKYREAQNQKNINNKRRQIVLTNEKSKKPNLYQRCAEEVNRRYEGTTLHVMLIEYLEYRIKSTLHPIGYTGWVGLLNKLDKFGQTESEKCKIVEQSLRMKWDTFVELKSYNSTKPRGREAFGEMGNVKSVPADRSNFMKGVTF